ncbi:MAG: GNAT family N-acetyltransferase [Deltaproteobacteria bacterium]|nr:GNAT family N-acetyltransferase [Deltaproteobacteria bacterium]
MSSEQGSSPNGKKGRRPALLVREMQIDDLAQIFHLGEQLFTPQDYPNLYRTWDEYEVVGLFQSDPENCLVAEQEGRLAGFLLGTTIEKRRSAWKYGYLVWLGVHPDFQRAGVAQKLFARFLDIMEETGARIILVDTQADNHPALAFFRRMGFRSPERHVFLSLNMDTHRREAKAGGHHAGVKGESRRRA